MDTLLEIADQVITLFWEQKEVRDVFLRGYERNLVSE